VCAIWWCLDEFGVSQAHAHESFSCHIFTQKHTSQHAIVTALYQPKMGPTTNQSHHVHPKHHMQLDGWSRVQNGLPWGLCGRVGVENDTFRVFSEKQRALVQGGEMHPSEQANSLILLVLWCVCNMVVS
jgi:hypothetical protein